MLDTDDVKSVRDRLCDFARCHLSPVEYDKLFNLDGSSRYSVNEMEDLLRAMFGDNVEECYEL